MINAKFCMNWKKTKLIRSLTYISLMITGSWIYYVDFLLLATVIPYSRAIETKFPTCCNMVSHFSSCQKACEQITLSLPKEIRYQKLANVHALCPTDNKAFWGCLNQIIDATDQAYGWLGWPCCNLALKQSCFLSCVTSTSTSQIQKTCRRSDEISFYQCIERQEEGETCCSNTSNEECKEACWRIFKKESSPTQDDKLYVQRKCGYNDQNVLRCIQNYTHTTPARNPAENLKCCQESSNSTCRDKCQEILLNSSTEQEIVDKLIENCGQPIPSNALWQCFIRNSEVNTNDEQFLYGGSSETNSIDDENGLLDMPTGEEDGEDIDGINKPGTDSLNSFEAAGKPSKRLYVEQMHPHVHSADSDMVEGKKNENLGGETVKEIDIKGGPDHLWAQFPSLTNNEWKEHQYQAHLVEAGAAKSGKPYLTNLNLLDLNDIDESMFEEEPINKKNDNQSPFNLDENTIRRAGALYKKHHYHPASKLDIAGLDAVKLQCCSKAITQVCIDLCTKSFSLDANDHWSEFSEHCQYSPVEVHLITCLSEVDEPCSIGCHTPLPFCGHLFNRRPLDLFRSCTLTSDNSARDLVNSWFTESTISLPALDIPVINIKECALEHWVAIACLLEVKPCHVSTHSNLICRADCINILNKCVNRGKLLPGQTPEYFCNILSPVNPDQPCISVEEYINGSTVNDGNGKETKGYSFWQDFMGTSGDHVFDKFNAALVRQTHRYHPTYTAASDFRSVFDEPVTWIETHSFEFYFKSLIARKSPLDVCNAGHSRLTNIAPNRGYFHRNQKPSPKLYDAGKSGCPRGSVCVANRQLYCSSANQGPGDPQFELPFSGIFDKSQCHENFNSRNVRDIFGYKSHRNSVVPSNAHLNNNATSCLPGCNLGEVSNFYVPHGSYVQLPINGKSLNCHRICQCLSVPHNNGGGGGSGKRLSNELVKCHQISCLGVNHCWVQESVKMHLSQFSTDDCNLCTCHNGIITCTIRNCPNMRRWSEPNVKTGYTGLPCNCPGHYIPVCATNGKTYQSACIAKCAGLSDESFEYGACPSAGSKELQAVCKPLRGNPSNDLKNGLCRTEKTPASASSLTSSKHSKLYKRTLGDRRNRDVSGERICLPFRQVCLSTATANLESLLARKRGFQSYGTSDGNELIPVSTCPQHLCVKNDLSCSSNMETMEENSFEICSLLRAPDYRLYLPPAPTFNPRCLKKLYIRSQSHLQSLLYNVNYNKFMANLKLYRFRTRLDHGSDRYNNQNLNMKVPNNESLDLGGEYVDVTGILPVCGYDGETYLDECQALMNGALVDYSGPCVTAGILGIKYPINNYHDNGNRDQILLSQPYRFQNEKSNNLPFHIYESNCPPSGLIPSGRILCDDTRNTIVLPSGPRNEEFRKTGTSRNFNDVETKDLTEKYVVRCRGIIPPGGCCPICAAEMRVLFSTELANLYARESEYGPVTVNQVTAKLRRHLRVLECDIFGYLSMENDLVFLIVPVEPSSQLNSDLHPLRVAKRDDIVLQALSDLYSASDKPKSHNNQNPDVPEDEDGNEDWWLKKTTRKGDGLPDLEKLKRMSNYENVSPSKLFLWVDGGNIRTIKVIPSSNSSSRGTHQVGSDKLVALPVTPFATSPLHIDICNKEAQRLASLINSQSPTLTSELPMPILLSARVRTSKATVNVINSATRTSNVMKDNYYLITTMIFSLFTVLLTFRDLSI